MRDHKTRKIAMIIVTLLLILQIVAIGSQAGIGIGSPNDNYLSISLDEESLDGETEVNTFQKTNLRNLIALDSDKIFYRERSVLPAAIAYEKADDSAPSTTEPEPIPLEKKIEMQAAIATSLESSDSSAKATKTPVSGPIVNIDAEKKYLNLEIDDTLVKLKSMTVLGITYNTDSEQSYFPLPSILENARHVLAVFDYGSYTAARWISAL